MSSSVSPELEMAIRRSTAVIMPRSPWLASPGWTKNAGVPVLASVAATLPAMWPDLPMPVTTTRPRQSRQQLAGAVETGVEPRREAGDGGGLDLEDAAAPGPEVLAGRCSWSAIVSHAIMRRASPAAAGPQFS